jgi:uncharacterized protein
VAASRLLIVVVIGFCALLMSGCSSEAEPDPVSADESVLDVTLKGEVFRLELALDDDSRTQGLSDREEIAADGGMLFVFPEEKQRSFWMLRCPVPIDIAFLDARGEVVWMHAMQVEPDPNKPVKQYNSHYPAQFAVELREGTIRRLGLAQEDRIDLPIEALKDRVR